MSSQYATKVPTATTNKPTPVAAIPVLIPFKAVLADCPKA